jgi:hypothetical protein
MASAEGRRSPVDRTYKTGAGADIRLQISPAQAQSVIEITGAPSRTSPEYLAKCLEVLNGEYCQHLAREHQSTEVQVSDLLGGIANKLGRLVSNLGGIETDSAILMPLVDAALVAGDIPEDSGPKAQYQEIRNAVAAVQKLQRWAELAVSRKDIPLGFEQGRSANRWLYEEGLKGTFKVHFDGPYEILGTVKDEPASAGARFAYQVLRLMNLRPPGIKRLQQTS